MKELPAILKRYAAAASGERLALATIVKTTGSSYRRPGAHMLIDAEGNTVGSISGGCLERDVIEHARKVSAEGKPVLLTYDTTMEEDVMFGVGLGCKGVIEILVEPLGVNENADPFFGWLRELFMERKDGVVTTIFRGGEQIGRRFAVFDDGRLEGEVGEWFLNEAREALRTGRSATKELEGMEAFMEVIHAPTRLFIFGAGYDAAPLTRMAKEVGFEVTVVDRRPAYADRARFPEADAVVVAGAKEVCGLGLDDSSAAVVMGHHYLTDRDYLRALLPIPLRYLGLMGPRRRAEKMFQEFREEGVLAGDDLLGKVHNPIGLDIGAEGPEQITLAILAEIQAVLAGHAGGLLREKKGPIHAPRTELV